MRQTLFGAGALLGAALFATAAAAAPGVATGNVNMRSGPGTQYAKITTVPAGAPVEVLGCSGWCEIAFAGRQGFVSANYVDTNVGQRLVYRPAPPPVAYYDDDYYDYGGPYYDSAPVGGVYFGFNSGFGGHHGHDHWRHRHGRSGIGFGFGF